jgi:predicted nucleotidyltransferase
MEKIIKKTREVGTSAGVLLPRKWLNRSVVVTLLEKSEEDILHDVIRIIFEKGIDDVKGIYFVGSYARHENEPESDIDILIITEETNKLIDIYPYEITLVKEETLKKNLFYSLYYYSMVNEARPLINKSLINSLKTSIGTLKKDRLLEEINRINSINKDSISMYKDVMKNIPDGLVYSVILRLRELYLLKCIKDDIKYRKIDFLKYVDENLYNTYLRVKRDEKEVNDNDPDKVKLLIDLSEKWLKEIKK